MQVDWGLVVTQAVGFIVAVLVLRRFAWRPILANIDARRAKIKRAFDDADAAQNRLDALTIEYESKLSGIDATARERIQAAVKDGQRIAAEIAEKARADAHAHVERMRAQLAREYDAAKVAMRDEMIVMTVNATRRLLRETVDDKAHRELIRRYLDELGEVAH